MLNTELLTTKTMLVETEEEKKRLETEASQVGSRVCGGREEARQRLIRVGGGEGVGLLTTTKTMLVETEEEKKRLETEASQVGSRVCRGREEARLRLIRLVVVCVGGGGGGGVC